MVKKILSLLVCISLCLSFVALGVANLKAKEPLPSDATKSASANTDIQSIAVDESGVKENLLSYDKTFGEYILTGNVTVTKANAATNATYQALVALLENTADSTFAVILNGNGYTITTEISLFHRIGNCTIKNLNVVGDTITLQNSDFITVSDNNVAFGVIASYAHRHVTLHNVRVDVDVYYSGDAGSTQINVGGFIGYGGVYYMTNCTNDGDVTVIPSSCARLSAGGFFGYKDEACGILMENCINNGNIKAIKAGNKSDDCYAGGFSGISYGRYDIINNSMNAGNVTALQDTNNASRAGGLVGHCFSTVPTDCINLGDISLTSTTTAYNTAIGTHRVGGIVGNGHYSTPFTRCVNAGDITLTAANTTRSTAGGISPWLASGSSTFTECVNLGNVQVFEGHSASLKVASGITPHNDASLSRFVNCYTVFVANDFNKSCNHVSNQSGGIATSNVDSYYITVTSSVEALLERVKSEQINNAKALITAILALADYDSNFAHDKDDGMVTSSFRNFKSSGTEEVGRFTAEIDSAFYNDLAALAESIEFGAIITLQSYVTKVGELTHEALDAYLEANKAANANLQNIDALYMTATFRDGRPVQTLTDAELSADGESYRINVTLKNATEGVTYVAKTFIKIGNTYIYSN